jgi:hypothetical protein
LLTKVTSSLSKAQILQFTLCASNGQSLHQNMLKLHWIGCSACSLQAVANDGHEATVHDLDGEPGPERGEATFCLPSQLEKKNTLSC